MPGKCPLCGQSLPHALDQHELESRILKLSSPALTAERKKLKEVFDSRLESAVEKSRLAAQREYQRQLRETEERVRLEVQSNTRKQVAAAEKRAKDAETSRRRDVERVRKEEQARLRTQIAQSVRLVGLQNEAKLTKLQAERERDRKRHEEEVARYQSKVDDLSRRMEKQSGEQLRAEAERDLLAELRSSFPGDDINPIGRGVKGADILHVVKDSSRIVGKIVYESKNTLTWLNEFIVQAKKYRTQYETPHVMVATRVFPSKLKGFCVVKGVPVVEPRLAVALATVVREGIIEIARLRLSTTSYDEKSVELYQYIVGDKFCTRFRELAEGVDALRAQQQSGRRWHENSWQAESKIHDLIASRHREVDAQIRAICRGVSYAEKSKTPGRSEPWSASPFIAASSR
jgi:hypothetical protein